MESLEHVSNGELPPRRSSPTLPLADAARGYQVFEKKQQDCRKVVPTPG